MAKNSIIITAGGIGKRMQSSLPKQFIQIVEKPILMYTIERFYHFDPKSDIIVTLPLEWMGYWEELLLEQDFRIPHRVVEGGKERYNSIKNALEKCNGDIISVHDGVRPLVSDETLRNCFRTAREKGTAVPVVPIKESVRLKTENGTQAVDRSDYLIVQTPQSFRKEIIEEAYAQDYHKGITDDASLVEEAGYVISTVSGNVENIKITDQSDLKFAELFLK